jgi:hypothetical protein
MTASQIKILVSVFLVLAIWRIFELPGVATAFWAFITVGAIPGTARILGTETLMRILCIVFAASIFLIFRKEFMASLPRRTVKTQAADAVHRLTPIPAVPTPSARERIIVTLATQKDRPALASVRPLVMLFGQTAAWIIQLTCWVEAFCRRVMRVAARHIIRAYQLLSSVLGTCTKTLYRTVLAAGRYIMYASIIAWKMMEPHIRTFDRWLDKQLHANKSTAEVLQFMSDLSKGAAESYRRAEEATRKLRRE